MGEPQSSDERSGSLALDVRNELPEHPSGRFAFRGGFEPEPEPEESLPNRYEIRDREDGRVLLSGEAPGVAVSIDRGHNFSEADARRMGQRVTLSGNGSLNCFCRSGL